MYKRGKKGSDFLSDNLLGIIIAAVSMVVLLLLLFGLTQAFSFNKEDIVAVSYSNALGQSLKYAKDAGKDQFVISQDMSPARYFLVYFGDESYKSIDSFDTYEFFFKSTPKNTLCVCPVSEFDVNVITCQKKYCQNLKQPISTFGKNGVLPLEQGVTIDFEYTEQKYKMNIIDEGVLISSRYSTSDLRKDECNKTINNDVIIQSLGLMERKRYLKSCYEDGSTYKNVDLISKILAKYQDETDSFIFTYYITNPPKFFIRLGINPQEEMGLVGYKKDSSDLTKINLKFSDNEVGEMDLINGNINIYPLFLDRVLVSGDKEFTLDSLQEQTALYSLQYNTGKYSYIFKNSEWFSSAEDDDTLKNLDFQEGLSKLKTDYSDTLTIIFIQ